MSRDSLLYAVLAGFVGGIFARSFVDLGLGFSLFFVLLAIVLSVVNRKVLLLAAIFLFA